MVKRKKLVGLGLGLVLGGCSVMPEYGKIELDHISHIQTGQITTCTTSEDCITQLNILIGYEGKPKRSLELGSTSSWYFEGGIGWMPKNQGFYGGELTATARFGRKITFKE